MAMQKRAIDCPGFRARAVRPGRDKCVAFQFTRSPRFFHVPGVLPQHLAFLLLSDGSGPSGLEDSCLNGSTGNNAWVSPGPEDNIQPRAVAVASTRSRHLGRGHSPPAEMGRRLFLDRAWLTYRGDHGRHVLAIVGSHGIEENVC